MENQTQTPDPIANLTAKVLTALMEGINQMVDERVERIMATQASAAVFNDTLDERIKTIAQEEAKEAFDSVEDEIHDKVKEEVSNLDIEEQVMHVFRHRANWEEHVQEYVDNELEDKVSEEISNQIDDAVESKLDDVLEEKISDVLDENLEAKIKEVLIKIIKGE